jgi:hypothetical protein
MPKEFWRLNNRPAPTREQLINSLSILGQLKHSLEILRRLTENMLIEPQTADTKHLILTTNEAANKLLKIVKALLHDTQISLDECIASLNVLKKVKPGIEPTD